MTLTIARGRGYVPAEGNEDQETLIGVIPVDSIFSPVRAPCSYDVDAARVGQRTDFDKLKLEVTTNGSMTPFVVTSSFSSKSVRWPTRAAST